MNKRDRHQCSRCNETFSHAIDCSRHEEREHPTRFEQRARQTVTRDALVGLLTDLRREIAGDGPHVRTPGALEAFDVACQRLGTPFIKP